jgi:hypothetical protein
VLHQRRLELLQPDQPAAVLSAAIELQVIRWRTPQCLLRHVDTISADWRRQLLDDDVSVRSANDADA